MGGLMVIRFWCDELVRERLGNWYEYYRDIER